MPEINKGNNKENNKPEYLIIEGNVLWGNDCREIVKKLGYEPIWLMPYTVVGWDNPLEWNKNHQPSIVQLDGLDGKCLDLYEQIIKDNPKAHCFVYSGDMEVKKEAEKRGIPFLFKTESLRDYIQQVIQGAK